MQAPVLWLSLAPTLFNNVFILYHAQIPSLPALSGPKTESNAARLSKRVTIGQAYLTSYSGVHEKVHNKTKQNEVVLRRCCLIDVRRRNEWGNGHALTALKGGLCTYIDCA
jgi:hypothetical protein